MSTRLTRAEVARIVAEARAAGNRPDLSRLDLRGADLRGADLSWADLRGADLRNSVSRILTVTGLPSGDTYYVPTPDGWVLHVGCETGSTDSLRALIAGENWPSRCDLEERERRRPGLALLADLCDAHAAMWPDVVRDLSNRWAVTA